MITGVEKVLNKVNYSVSRRIKVEQSLSTAAIFPGVYLIQLVSYFYCKKFMILIKIQEFH